MTESPGSSPLPKIVDATALHQTHQPRDEPVAPRMCLGLRHRGRESCHKLLRLPAPALAASISAQS
jgi:hypothetical protein